MAVSVSRDLTVQVLEDGNRMKLIEGQLKRHSAIQKGEPKCLGVSQVMLGLLVMFYSLPLHFSEFTQVVIFGVPWWSGALFFTAGVIAIILDNNCTLKLIQVCLTVSGLSVVLSVVAILIYSIDLFKHEEHTCLNVGYYDTCDFEDLSRELKILLLLFTLAQLFISAFFSFFLYRKRQTFDQYFPISHSPPDASPCAGEVQKIQY